MVDVITFRYVGRLRKILPKLPTSFIAMVLVNLVTFTANRGWGRLPQPPTVSSH
jgi:hypothetical protein